MSDRAAESWVSTRLLSYTACFCVTAPQSRQLPSAKRTQDAVCEASFWPHGAMATPTKTAACISGAGRERESGLGIGWMGSRHRGAVNLRRWLSSSRLLQMNYKVSKQWTPQNVTCASRDGRGKKTSSEESEEVTVKTEQPATCCMICQGEKKVTKLKRGSFGKSSKTDEPAVWLQPPPEERTEISRLHGQDRLPHRVKTRANRYLISPWGHASHTHLSPKFNPWAPPPTHTKWEMGQTSFLQSGLLFMKDKDITKKTHVCKWKTFQRQLQHMRLGQKWFCILEM